MLKSWISRTHNFQHAQMEGRVALLMAVFFIATTEEVVNSETARVQANRTRMFKCIHMSLWGVAWMNILGTGNKTSIGRGQTILLNVGHYCSLIRYCPVSESLNMYWSINCASLSDKNEVLS